MRQLLILILSVAVLLPARAQGTIQGVGHTETIGLRTNLLYDAALLPNIGVEYGFADRWSVVADVTADWIQNDRSHHYWRIFAGELEARRWLGSDYRAYRLQGHHVGLYAALYRYDIEFGSKGHQSDLSYGGGICYGYSIPLGSRLAIDLSLGLGYIGGKYKEYEPRNGEYYWLADKQRHYFGPTRAEATLCWHIDLPKKRRWVW